jgi:hypothetical protein
VTVCRICRMVNNGCFADGMGHEPGKGTVLEHQNDEAAVFEEFFTAGLRMPLHPVLADILLKYQIQIQQLMRIAIAQLSKYVWAITSFGGVSSTEGFTKRYELRYQPRNVDIDGVEMLGQYGYINFHTKRGGQWCTTPGGTVVATVPLHSFYGICYSRNLVQMGFKFKFELFLNIVF